MATETEPIDVVQEDDLRQQILREREAVEAERVAREQELDEESLQLERELEEQIRGEFQYLSPLIF